MFTDFEFEITKTVIPNFWVKADEKASFQNEAQAWAVATVWCDRAESKALGLSLTGRYKVPSRQFEVTSGANFAKLPQMALPISQPVQLLTGEPQEEAKQEEI